MTEKYGEMLAAYPTMLEVRRKHFQLQAEYIQTLETVWTTSLALQGFLLTDGLESPSVRSEVPQSISAPSLGATAPMPLP